MDPQELERVQHQLIVDAGTDLRPIADRAWDFERARLNGRRFVTIDLEAASEPNARNYFGETNRDWVSALAASSYTERFRLLAKAVIAMAAQEAPWQPPAGQCRPISAKPADEAWYRRCVRVLAMVHELHKAGYQRIRILPMLSPSGCYWRGIVTFSENVAEDGYNILNWDHDDEFGTVAKYTSGDENEFFGWRDAKSLNARQLAVLFIERFPVIASRGVGCDWAYAGWLTDVLGEAEAGPERGSLIHLLQDWDTDPAYMQRWQPPPPIRTL
jgi:hypothetical protein